MNSILYYFGFHCRTCLIQNQSRKMHIKIIDNIVDFKKLKSKWQYLYEKDNQYSVFQSFDFNYFSWTNDLQHQDSKLTIICVEIKNKICSIFPLYIDSEKEFDL